MERRTDNAKATSPNLVWDTNMRASCWSQVFDVMLCIVFSAAMLNAFFIINSNMLLASSKLFHELI